MLHRKVLQEFDFDHCTLRTGTWDEALAPLSRITGNDEWKKDQSTPPEEYMDVPLVLSPVEEKCEVECIVTKLWEDEYLERNRGLRTLRLLGMKTRHALPLQVKRLLSRARLGWLT